MKVIIIIIPVVVLMSQDIYLCYITVIKGHIHFNISKPLRQTISYNHT